MANHQPRRHLRSNHQLWKMHVLLGCSAQYQPVRQSTENFAQGNQRHDLRRNIT